MVYVPLTSNLTSMSMSSMYSKHNVEVYFSFPKQSLPSLLSVSPLFVLPHFPQSFSKSPPLHLPLFLSSFKFPSVFVIYGTLSAAILDVFVLIGYMNRTKLFCSSRNLVESYLNATPFCSFVGEHIVYELVAW